MSTTETSSTPVEQGSMTSDVTGADTQTAQPESVTSNVTEGKTFTQAQVDEIVRARLAEERGPAYAEAHIRIRSGDGAHGEVVDAIIRALEDYLGGASRAAGSSGNGAETNDRSSPA